jgi:hypothetical protein
MDSSFSFPQHPDQHRPKLPVFLAVDHEFDGVLVSGFARFLRCRSRHEPTSTRCLEPAMEEPSAELGSEMAVGLLDPEAAEQDPPLGMELDVLGAGREGH